MSRRLRDSGGFSMIEMLIVLSVLGIMIAMGVPALQGLSQSHQLRGTSEDLVGSINLQRSRAMATGQTITIKFNTAQRRWTVLGNTGSVVRLLPNGISYASANPTSIQIGSNGTVNTSGLVVFQNQRGALDTVSVLVSGLALIR